MQFKGSQDQNSPSPPHYPILKFPSPSLIPTIVQIWSSKSPLPRFPARLQISFDHHRNPFSSLNRNRSFGNKLVSLANVNPTSAPPLPLLCSIQVLLQSHLRLRPSCSRRARVVVPDPEGWILTRLALGKGFRGLSSPYWDTRYSTPGRIDFEPSRPLSIETSNSRQLLSPVIGLSPPRFCRLDFGELGDDTAKLPHTIILSIYYLTSFINCFLL